MNSEEVPYFYPSTDSSPEESPPPAYEKTLTNTSSEMDPLLGRRQQEEYEEY
eukprot:Pgem_evm1s17428